MKVFLRTADPADPLDGQLLIFDGDEWSLPDVYEGENRTWYRHPVRCGTAAWTEYWDVEPLPEPERPRKARR